MKVCYSNLVDTIIECIGHNIVQLNFNQLMMLMQHQRPVKMDLNLLS